MKKLYKYVSLNDYQILSLRSMRTVLLSERNYYKYKTKISIHLEEIPKERSDSAI
jgi:hypothetical protein